MPPRHRSLDFGPLVLSALAVTASMFAPTLGCASPLEAQAPLPVSIRPGAAVAASEATRLVEAGDRCFREAVGWLEGERRIELFKEAEALAERAIATDPEYAEAYFLMFAARGTRILDGNPMRSIFELPALDELLTRTLELNPDHSHALASKAGMLLDLPRFLGGDPEKAKELILRALVLNSKGPTTRLSMARILLTEGRPSEARKNILLAGHYACVTRRRDVLDKAVKMLADLP